MPRAAVVLAGLLVSGASLAQESAGFKLNEHVLGAGGHPADGVVLQSQSYTISFDVIGESVLASSLMSGSFRMSAGFVQAYVPPGEVKGLKFADPETLVWSPEGSAGAYNLYRDATSTLPGLQFGECAQQALPQATATDTDPVPPGDCFFYLITATNLLNEEGPKGFQSDGTEREGTVCP